MDKNKTGEKRENVVDKILSYVDGDTKVVLADRLLDKKIISILKDDELMSSVEAFFDNSLNISETSRNAFMHRNTLLYRLEKIHKLTGLNLRDLNDAVSFMFYKSIYEKTKNIR